MTIHFVSVVVAFFIGGVEALGLLKDKLNLSGGFWDLVGNLNDHFGSLGFIIIGVFVISWAGSMIVFRLMRYDQITKIKRPSANAALDPSFGLSRFCSLIVHVMSHLQVSRPYLHRHSLHTVALHRHTY